MNREAAGVGSPGRSWPVWVLPGLGYYLVARLSLFLAIPPSEAAAVWPAAGIAVGSLLLWGNRVLPGLAAGVFAFYLHSWLNGETLPALLASLSLSLLLVTGPVLQAWVTARVIHRLLGRHNALVEDRSILTFMLLAVPLGCMTAASINLSVMTTYGILPLSEFGFNWLNWWVGDSIGVLLVAPMMLEVFGQRRRALRYRKFAVGVPLLLLLTAVFALFALARQSEEQAREQAFDKQVTALHGRIVAGADESLDVLFFLKSFFEASTWVSERDFDDFTRLPLRQNRHLQALAWIPRVTAAQRGAYEARASRPIRLPDGQGGMTPAPAAAVYFPIRYIRPLAGNEKAREYNVLHNPNARQALTRALASGEPAATAAFRLVQETGDRLGFVIYLPVSGRGGGSPVGAVEAVFRVDDFIDAMAGAGSLESVGLRLVDLSAGAQVLYRSPGLAPARALYDRLHLKSTRTLTVAGRRWQIEYYPSATFVAESASWAVWAVLVGGMLLTTLLGGWLLSLTGRNIQISEQVREKTEFLLQEIDQRRHAEAELTKLSSAVEHSPNMVVITDAAGAIEYVNPRFMQSTGYRPDEVQGRAIAMLHAGDPGDGAYGAIWTALGVDGEWRGEVLNRRKGGEPYWAEVHISAILDGAGTCTHYVSLMQDITESKRISEQVAYQASHDALTGLINRRAFEQRLEQLLFSAKRGQAEHAFCFLDLDQFKVVNDTSGHVAGDELLRQLGTLLREQVRRSDTVARLGGDEFGVLMERCSAVHAERMAEQLRAAVEQYRFVWEGRIYSVGVSIGLVGIDRGSQSATELFKQADSACYVAKDAGRNRIHRYTDDDEELARRRGEINWVADINAALEQDRFELYGQLIAPIRRPAEAPGVEVLLRLRTPEGRLVPPGAFLAAAERYNISTRIDRWVIEHLFDWLAAHPEIRGRIAYFAINLSGLSLGDRGLLETLTRLLSRHEVAAQTIKFEITETTAISNLTEARGFIDAVKGFGCQFALDDFGSGVSSFAYLKHLPVDALKIDGLFVKDILDDEIDLAMVRAINEVGHVMGMDTIAEFVENAAILERLADIGVDYAQGYGICRPMPLDQLVSHPRVAGAAPAAGASAFEPV